MAPKTGAGTFVFTLPYSLSNSCAARQTAAKGKSTFSKQILAAGTDILTDRPLISNTLEEVEFTAMERRKWHRAKNEEIEKKTTRLNASRRALFDALDTSLNVRDDWDRFETNAFSTKELSRT